MNQPARPTLAAVANFADTVCRDRSGRDTGWQDQAACAGLASSDPRTDPFFPITGTSTRGGEYAFAKSICAQCPVRVECADWAIDTHQAHGLWGGLTPDERRRARRAAERFVTTADEVAS